MKPFKKVLAALIAVVIALSATACMPVSLTKEWSYKTEDSVLNQEYAMGIYIYELYAAYNNAASYAEKADGYKEDESFLGLTIEDGDGNKAVAKDWILQKAEENTLSILAVDYLIAKHGATLDEAQMKTAKENAKSAWDVGPYAQSGYYNPMSKVLYDYGVSLESFTACYSDGYNLYPFTVKQSVLFEKLYDKDGVEEVSDKELNKYFEKNYIDYTLIPVNLYTSETDEDGNSTSKAFSAKKIKKIKTTLQEYADQLSSGKSSLDDIKKVCENDYGTASDSVVENQVSTKTDFKSSYADIYKKFKKLDNGKADLVVVGESGDSPTAYIVIKNDVTKRTKEYVEANRASVLQNCKTEDFTDFVKNTGKQLKDSGVIKKNDGAVGKYDPEIFFKKD